MALVRNMVAHSTTLDHEIQIHNMQVEYIALLLTAEYDSSYFFTPILSCIIPTEVQRYCDLLPMTLLPTSLIINSSRQCESTKKKEVRSATFVNSLLLLHHKLYFVTKNKLGRLYNPDRPLAMEERQEILHLHKKGYRISHIARIIGATHSCVSKIMARYRQTGSMQPRILYPSKRRNTDYNNGIDDNTISDNNYQKLCKSFIVNVSKKSMDNTSKVTYSPTRAFKTVIFN